MAIEIPGIDDDDLSVYAFAQMYAAMRQAEQFSVDYNYNNDELVNSRVGDRTVPRTSDLDTLAGNTKFFMDRARTYAEIFLAAEMADDSPRRHEFQRAIKLVDALRAKKSIPRPRTP